MDAEQQRRDVHTGGEPSGTQPTARSVGLGQDPLLLPPGLVLAGKYRVDEMLARGGMGAVYAATQVATGKRVAIKFRLPRCSEQRFSSEAVAAARIRHPNVIDIYDVSAEQGVSYLVMELLEGETLAALIKRGRLPVPEALSIVISAAEGVSAAHAKGIIHRDLKPDNIFVCAEPGGTRRIKVLDFGIAKIQQSDAAAHGAITESGALLGTPSYMAPEQLHSPNLVDARSDIYSLGVIIYEALTGQKPFSSTNYNVLVVQISTARALSPDQLHRDIPASVAQLVQRAMAPDVGARFQSAEELLGALRRELTGEVPESLAGAISTEALAAPSPPRRWKVVAAALAVVAVALTAALVLRAPGRQQGRPAAALVPNAPVIAEALSPAARVPLEDAKPPPSVEVPVADVPSVPTAEPARNAVPVRAQARKKPRVVLPAQPRVQEPVNDWAGPLSESELR